MRRRSGPCSYAAVALLVVFGLLLRMALPGVAQAAPQTIEALTGTIICAHDADGAPEPASPVDHSDHAGDCCTAACTFHLLPHCLSTTSHLVTWDGFFTLTRPLSTHDLRAPRPPPRSVYAPRGPPFPV